MNELEGQIRMLLANGRAEDIDADQILALCDELAASRTIYQSAVKGRQDMRDALRSERDETKALRAPSATEAAVSVATYAEVAAAGSVVGLMADAERYRFLCEQRAGWIGTYAHAHWYVGPGALKRTVKEQMDFALDKALAAASPAKQPKGE